VWFVAGNDELAQDYDILGERELIPGPYRTGLPFGVLLSLGVVGFAVLQHRRRAGSGPFSRTAAPWLWVAGGQVLAVLVANLAYFTSAQHRLPLCVPLAFLAGPALMFLYDWVRSRRAPARLMWVSSAVALLLLVQSFWPRSSRRRPSTAHYYNLAVAQHTIGETAAAVETLNKAIERRPRQPEFLLDRARMSREIGRFQVAQADLTALTEMRKLPTWLLRQAVVEQALLSRQRRERLGESRR
jgi:hypothetical protein